MGKEENMVKEDYSAVEDQVEAENEVSAGEIPDKDKLDCGAATYSETDPQKVISLLEEQLAGAKGELEETQNRLIRLQADFENFRKRNQKEREDLIKFACEGLICSLLPVLDNLERALTVQGDEQGLQSGVEMIYRQLNEILQKEGLEPICALGEQFDPNTHQAVMMIESAEHSDNEVIDEFQKGYSLKDKVIRPAVVKVAKNN